MSSQSNIDLAELIAVAQSRRIPADAGIIQDPVMTPMKQDTTFAGPIATAILGAGLTIFGGAILGAAIILANKIDKIEAIIDRGVVVMEKLPEATNRMEQLLERTDVTVKRGFTELKEATPSVGRGLIDGLRNGLNKQP